MPDDRNDIQGGKRKHISAEDARGGEIILRSRTRRLIFIAGLVGLMIVALIVRFTVYG